MLDIAYLAVGSLNLDEDNGRPGQIMNEPMHQQLSSLAPQPQHEKAKRIPTLIPKKIDVDWRGMASYLVSSPEVENASGKSKGEPQDIAPHYLSRFPPSSHHSRAERANTEFLKPFQRELEDLQAFEKRTKYSSTLGNTGSGKDSMDHNHARHGRTTISRCSTAGSIEEQRDDCIQVVKRVRYVEDREQMNYSEDQNRKLGEKSSTVKGENLRSKSSQHTSLSKDVSKSHTTEEIKQSSKMPKTSSLIQKGFFQGFGRRKEKQKDHIKTKGIMVSYLSNKDSMMLGETEDDESKMKVFFVSSSGYDKRRNYSVRKNELRRRHDDATQAFFQEKGTIPRTPLKRRASTNELGYSQDRYAVIEEEHSSFETVVRETSAGDQHAIEYPKKLQEVLVGLAETIARHYEVGLLDLSDLERRKEKKNFRSALRAFRQHAKKLNIDENELFASVRDDVESSTAQTLSEETGSENHDTEEGDSSWRGFSEFDDGIDQYVDLLEITWFEKLRCGCMA